MVAATELLQGAHSDGFRSSVELSRLHLASVAWARYGNFWEYGFNVSSIDTPLDCDRADLSDFERDYCVTNLPLRTRFRDAWLPAWDGKSDPGKVDRAAMTHNGMDYSIVMDAASPAYVNDSPVY